MESLGAESLLKLVPSPLDLRFGGGCSESILDGSDDLSFSSRQLPLGRLSFDLCSHSGSTPHLQEVGVVLGGIMGGVGVTETSPPPLRGTTVGGFVRPELTAC